MTKLLAFPLPLEPPKKNNEASQKSQKLACATRKSSSLVGVGVWAGVWAAGQHR